MDYERVSQSCRNFAYSRTTLSPPRDVLKKIFQPLVTDIQRLVHDQVNLIKVKRLSEGHPKATDIKVRKDFQGCRSESDSRQCLQAIFLVGGFGSSEYLKQCLEAMHQDIQIIQPHDAWSATVKSVASVMT